MTYFHERRLTIIGAKAFHGPVRDGKGWFHLAMVVRHNLSLSGNSANLKRIVCVEIFYRIFVSNDSTEFQRIEHATQFTT